MRGTVFAFDPSTGEGAIGGEDGERHLFTRESLAAGVNVITPGKAVSFDLIDGVVRGVAPNNDPSRIIAAWLAILLGSVGFHKFYLGRTKAGLVVLGTLVMENVLTSKMPVFLLSIWGIIGLIEGVLYLLKPEVEFHEVYIRNERAWF